MQPLLPKLILMSCPCRPHSKIFCSGAAGVAATAAVVGSPVTTAVGLDFLKLRMRVDPHSKTPPKVTTLSNTITSVLMILDLPFCTVQFLAGRAQAVSSGCKHQEAPDVVAVWAAPLKKLKQHVALK